MNKNTFYTLVPLFVLGFGIFFPKLTAGGRGYVSIQAVAFQPQNEKFPYYMDGKEIFNYTGQSATYFAPVLLPHGVTVTKVTFYYFDEINESDNCGVAVLERHNNAGNRQAMASIVTNDDGISSNYDDEIDYAPIDNSLYSYYSSLFLCSGNVHAYSVIIEYTNLPLSLPLVLK
jgi:hypothetical protein